MTLQPMNSVKSCVKCGSTYHYGAQGGQGSKGDYAPGIEWHWGPCNQPCESVVKHQRLNNAGEAIEHLSRVCLICGFRWAEQCYQQEQASLPMESE